VPQHLLDRLPGGVAEREVGVARVGRVRAQAHRHRPEVARRQLVGSDVRPVLVLLRKQAGRET